MKFIAIDFETANSNRNSACEIGLVKVEDFKIIEEKQFLIKPEPNDFDYFNTMIHGISEKDVENEPCFDEIYNNLKEDFNNYPIIAHNASFDISVLRHCLEQYSIKFPTTSYSCTYQISKKYFKDVISYKLNAIADMLNIELEHHRALSDARACAEIAIHIFKNENINSFDLIEDNFNLKVGKLFEGGYKPSITKHKSTSYKISDLEFENKFDEENIFFSKNVVFTGTLESMVRKDAQVKVLEIGGECQSNVTSDTNFLIFGEQDYDKFGEGFKSSKIKKAEKLKLKGSDIELLSESQFLEHIK